MSFVAKRYQSRTSAQLEHLAREAEVATNQRRLEIAEERFRRQSIRPVSEQFSDQRSSENASD